MSYFRKLAEHEEKLTILDIVKTIIFLILVIPLSVFSIIITLLVMPFPPLLKRWQKWTQDFANSSK